MQMTSFGDTFSQAYEAVIVNQQSSTDKSCSAGLGCEVVRFSGDYLATARRWLDEAQQQMVPLAADVTSTTYDCQPLIKRNKCANQSIFMLSITI